MYIPKKIIALDLIVTTMHNNKNELIARYQQEDIFIGIRSHYYKLVHIISKNSSGLSQ